MIAIAQTRNPELLDPALPAELLPDHGLWPWFAASAAIAVLALAIWIFIRKLRHRPQSPVSLRNIAFSEATTALAAVTANDAREAAIQSSLILRRYLARAANDPALFETHEEFISRHNALASLTSEARNIATAGFSRLAELKYGPEVPSADPAEVIASSRALLESLHRGFAS